MSLTDEEVKDLNMNEIFNKIMSLKGQISNNEIKDEIYTISDSLKDFNNKENLSFYSISDWKISHNKFSNFEVFLAGISFGFLINALILFLTSDYLRKYLK